MNSAASKTHLILKAGLLGNAAFSFLSGLALLLGATPLARWLGLPDPRALQLVGGLLLPFAAHLLLAVRRPAPRLGELYYFSLMDGLWVVGSAALLLSGAVSFTLAGKWTVALVALAVADFLVLQLVGALSLRRALTSSRR